MTQPNLPFDISWLNDPERDDTAQRYAGLIALCEDRGHTPDALTVERIRLIMITDATANRLEARLAAQLDQPSQRVSGAQVNATTSARQHHARALDDFDAAYPQPPPEPVKQLPPGMATSLGRLCTDVYRERVNEVMERMAPELDPDEDPVVTTYFMEKDSGREFHYELPKEAYTDIIRKPKLGDPVHHLTREPMIPMRYRERQAKWDEIRRLKAEAKAKEEAEAQAKEEAQPQSEPDLQQETTTTQDLNATTPNSAHHPIDPSDPSDPSDSSHHSHSSHASRRSGPAKADHSHSPLIPSPPPIGVHLSRRSPAKADRCAPVPPKPREGGSVAKNPPAPDPEHAAAAPQQQPHNTPQDPSDPPDPPDPSDLPPCPADLSRPRPAKVFNFPPSPRVLVREPAAKNPPTPPPGPSIQPNPAHTRRPPWETKDPK